MVDVVFDVKISLTFLNESTLSPAEMQRLVEEKQRVLKHRKKEHQKEGKQDGSRAASSSITDRRTSLTRDAARKKKKLKNY